MKKLLILIFALSSVSSLFCQTLSEKLNKYFDTVSKIGSFNGAVLITKGNETLIDKGFGYKNIEAKTLNDANTIFQIGSVTKQFTSTIILRLVEKGKLSLTDRIGKYFPEYPAAANVTIENLLSHTGGIYNYTRDTAFMANDVEKPFNKESLLKMIKDKPLDFQPGTKYSYSNSGYLMLGYIIEKVTGKKYEKVVRDEIFVPLKMTHSGFDFTHLNSSDKATGYSQITKTSASKSMIVDSSVSFSAGAMYTTLDDLHKWNEAVLSKKVLSSASYQNAFTTRRDKYGLGWSIDTVAGKTIITHNGGIHGFLSHNTIVPAENMSITILSNSNSTPISDISGDVFAILFNIAPKAVVQSREIAIDPAVLNDYVGEYELAPTFQITVTLVNGALQAQATGQPAFAIFPKQKDLFFLKVVDAQVEFVRNADNKVDKLILHQNGRDIPGQKVK